MNWKRLQNATKLKTPCILARKLSSGKWSMTPVQETPNNPVWKKLYTHYLFLSWPEEEKK